MGLWAKFLNLIGFEEEDEIMEESNFEQDDQKPRYRPNVVELQTAKNIKLVVLGPKSYEDVQAIVDHLRARRPVVVNLEGAEQKARLRILDFLSGAAYALGGRNQRVSDYIFLVAPHNVDINNLLEENVLEQLDEGGKLGGL